jgi:subtilisin-like proprotein convertase family protein
MKNFTLKSIFTVLALLLSIASYSQERSCGMLEYMEEMLKDPVLAKEYEANQKKFKAEVARRVSSDYVERGGATIEIPVAVHFPTANEADRACLEALAQNQIDILNADYTATNADINLWGAASQFYPGLNPGSANISFCLAVSNHPVGIDPELLEGNPAVTIGYNFGGGNNIDSNWSGYMNFVVRPISGDILGFSPLGGSVAAGQAVTMNTFAFGSGVGCPGSNITPGAPYNLGRTVTHELGHFYNLNHPWGPNAPSCAADDGIADTPNTGQATYGCPGNATEISCGNIVLTMNYMDYVNDACMYMFTPQQMAVAETYVSSVLVPQFKPDVCTPATPGFLLTADESTILSCPDTDTEVVYNLNYTTVLDFNETTTFTANGLPANATVNFSPSSLNNDGSFTMTVGNLGATAPGTYTIEVVGTSSSVTESIDVVLDNNCCQSYSATDLPLAISAGTAPITVESTINVTEDLPVLDVNVTIDVTHTWIGDLDVVLTSPEGTAVTLIDNRGGSGDDYVNTTFDQEGTDGPITGAAPPFTGSFVPEGDLSAIYGQSSAGDWTLTINDSADGDGGSFTRFDLFLCLEQPLSVSEFELDNFAIFPNPNNGEFTIKLNSNSGSDIKVDVLDIRGRRIFNNVYTNTGDFNETISLNSVQSGMYLVSVNDGNKKVTRRIIVE